MFQWLEEKIKRKSSTGNSFNEAGTSKEIDENNIFSDSNINGGSLIHLTLISLEGVSWSVDVPTELRITKLKSMCINYFYNQQFPVDIENLYKLILVPRNVMVAEDKTISENNICNGDELLLYYRSKKPPKPDNDIVIPTCDEIREATLRKPLKNVTKIKPLQDCTESYNAEFRKIMFTFVDISCDLLAHKPNTMEIMELMLFKIKTNNDTQPSSRDINNLVDMGFPPDRVKHALKLKRNIPFQALEWLLESDGLELGEDSEEPIVEIPSLSSESNQQGDFYSLKRQILIQLSLIRKKEFVPHQDKLCDLTGMGFDRNSSIDALRLTSNCVFNACEYLMGAKSKEEVDVDEPFSRDSQIFKIYLDNPIIIIGLNDRKVLLGLLEILENREKLPIWMSDIDIKTFFNEAMKIHNIERNNFYL